MLGCVAVNAHEALLFQSTSGGVAAVGYMGVDRGAERSRHDLRGQPFTRRGQGCVRVLRGYVFRFALIVTKYTKIRSAAPQTQHI